MRSRAGQTRQAGFTLLELIVVIVILGLVAALVFVRQPWHSQALNTEATVRTLTSALRLARSRAIAQDREVAVVTRGNGFVLDGGTATLLPAGDALTGAEVIFMPDGGASGATLILASGSRRIAISVNWLTGRVLSRELAGG